MASPASILATRIAYGARQLPRIAWYMGHGEIMRRLSKAVREREGTTARWWLGARLPLARDSILMSCPAD